MHLLNFQNQSVGSSEHAHDVIFRFLNESFVKRSYFHGFSISLKTHSRMLKSLDFKKREREGKKSCG